MERWVCYILKSIDSNKTYVGATNNLDRRLADHNRLNGQSRGAKATKGQQWIPILFISGFPNKIACLSFESGVRFVRKRKNKKYKITGSPIQKRIKSVYNLLYLGSPLNKWKSSYLQINWLELDHYIKSNENIIENKGILNIDI
jgi:predicted GIY-YIG superfamily endonuclease